MSELRELIKNESNRYAKRFYALLLDEGYKIANGNRYTNAHTHVFIRCDKGHGYYEVMPTNFISQGSRCPMCMGENNRKKFALTQSQFEDRVKESTDDEFEVIGKYINTETKILVKHKTCNHEYTVRPSNLLKGRGCPKCANRLEITDNLFKKRVSELVGEDYTFLEDYKDSSTPIKVQHRECGFTYNIAPNNFFRGRRCPQCTSSKGEKLVESILKKNNFTFTPQDKFDECRNKLPLPFDFGVYDNDELIALIEYQGIQHYKPVDFAGRGEEWAQGSFERIQQNDNIKRKFCKENNIPLIEIHYSLTDEQVSDFLLLKLNELTNKAELVV